MSKFISMLERLNIVEKVDDTMDENKETTNNLEEENIEMVEKQYKEDPVVSNKDYKVEEDNKKNMTVDEIYSMYELINSDMNTIFMLGNYLDALPESLPYNIKRESVKNILKVSNIELDELLSDGVRRLEVLNEFVEEYDNSIKITIDDHNREISKLKELIVSHEREIKNKKRMFKEQNKIIQYEVEKIENIINFFNKE